MSKASQRRLAAAQKREKEVFKKLPPFEQVIKMLPKLLMSSSGKSLWLKLFQQVNPDPPHEDRPPLVTWLKCIAQDHMPIFEASRHIRVEDEFDDGSAINYDDRLAYSVDAARKFGGRAFMDDDAGLFTLMEWIEPTDLVIRSVDGKPPSNQLATALNRVRDDSIDHGHHPEYVAIAFMIPTSDLAVCIAGRSETGAYAAAIVLEEDILVANSFALAEMMFCTATLPYQALDLAETEQEVTLTELRDILVNATDDDVRDPSSCARLYFSAMVRKLMQPAMDVQQYMALEHQLLLDELSAVDSVSVNALQQAKLAERGAAKVSREKQLHENRLTALQDQISRLRTQLATQNASQSPRGAQPENAPASVPLVQRLSCFFSH